MEIVTKLNISMENPTLFKTKSMYYWWKKKTEVSRFFFPFFLVEPLPHVHNDCTDENDVLKGDISGRI